MKNKKKSKKFMLKNNSIIIAKKHSLTNPVSELPTFYNSLSSKHSLHTDKASIEFFEHEKIYNNKLKMRKMLKINKVHSATPQNNNKIINSKVRMMNNLRLSLDVKKYADFHSPISKTNKHSVH